MPIAFNSVKKFAPQQGIPPLTLNKARNNSPEDSIGFLFKILACFGTNIFENQKSSRLIKFMKYVYPVSAYLIVVNFTAVVIVHVLRDLTRVKTNLANVSMNILSLALWHLLHTKRKFMIYVYRDLQKISKQYFISNVPKKCWIKIILMVNLSLMLVNASKPIISSAGFKIYCKVFLFFYWDDYCKTDLSKLYIFLVIFFTNAVVSMFSNLIALMYCALCCRCSALFAKFRKRIEMIADSKSYHMLQPKLGRDYLELINAAESVHSCFSLPCLIVFVISFGQGFITFARFMLDTRRELSLFFLIEHICSHIPTGSFAITVAVLAAQVFKEMERNKILFHKLYEEMSSDSNWRSRESELILETLKDIPPVTFTAWDMIAFRSSLIPAIFGAFLTYGLLVLSINT